MCSDSRLSPRHQKQEVHAIKCELETVARYLARANMLRAHQAKNAGIQIPAQVLSGGVFPDRLEQQANPECKAS